MEEFDKSEAASPYKLEQARSRGSVARSPEIAGAVVVLAAVVAFRAWNWQTARDLFAGMRAVLASPASVFGNAQGAWAAIEHAMLGALLAIAPFFVVIVLAAIVANVMQTGLVWSGFPLKPDLSRINPVTGFKRLFSMRTVFDAVKSLLKVGVLGTVLYFGARDAAIALFALPAPSAVDGLRNLLSMMGTLGLKMGVAAFLLACLDLLYSRHEFAKKMRMSRRDLKDEVKHREGDPRIRSRLRGLRIEMLKRAAAQKQVPAADVLIVNPTHLAVALKYQRGEMTAPVVLAKGAGSLALHMRATAARHGVPVVENRKLARALFFQADIQQTIPEALFADVAKVIVWVLAMRRSRQTTAGGVPA